MKKNMQNHGKIFCLIIIITAVSFVSAGIYMLCYQYDNKYTARGPQAQNGLLTLNEQTLKEHPYTFLVKDWEMYQGKLLTPEDFKKSPQPVGEMTFIGQYGGFEGKNLSPHGSSTYKMRILLPEKEDSYTLELPEIYSAYCLYVNGKLMKQMGNPNPASYVGETGNSSVTIQASKELELVIAVSDFEYFYSGMVYPPAFGKADAVASYLNIRYGLRMAGVVTALCIGLISLGIGFLSKPLKGLRADGDLTLLYALLCFCFVEYIGYPVVKTLLHGGMGWYYFENLCYCIIFLLVALIQHHISGWGGKTTKAFVLLGIFTCCCSLAVPWFLRENLSLMLAYSALLKVYTVAFSVFLTVSTAYGLYKGTTHSILMTAGMVAFDWALIFDRVFSGYEPILFGWFIELATGALVILIGIMLVRHIARQYRLTPVLEQQVEQASHMMEMQSAYYPMLLQKEQEAKATRHDFRHHTLVLRELAAQGSLSELLSYLDQFECAYLQPGEASYCDHYVVDMLLRLYAQRARQQRTALTAAVSIPEDIPIGNVDICVIFSNLMENALEACSYLPEDKRKVSIGINYQMSRLTIVVDNCFDGVLKVEGDSFFSRKRDNRVGIGLVSVKAVAEKYGGNAYFYPNKEMTKFHSEVMLTLRHQWEKRGEV